MQDSKPDSTIVFLLVRKVALEKDHAEWDTQVHLRDWWGTAQLFHNNWLHWPQ